MMRRWGIQKSLDLFFAMGGSKDASSIFKWIFFFKKEIIKEQEAVFLPFGRHTDTESNSPVHTDIIKCIGSEGKSTASITLTYLLTSKNTLLVYSTFCLDQHSGISFITWSIPTSFCRLLPPINILKKKIVSEFMSSACVVKYSSLSASRKSFNSVQPRTQNVLL